MSFATEIPLEEPAIVPEHFNNDIGFSDAFVAKHKGTIRHSGNENLWLIFRPGEGWERDSGAGIQGVAVDYARDLYVTALEAAKQADAATGAKMIQSTVKLGNKVRLTPMLDIARCHRDISIGSEELDRNPFIVGTENGIVDLTTGTFSPHTEGQLVTRRLATTYDSTSTAPTFERFLSEVQPEQEMRDFLQRWAGYCLTGAIREHVLPFHFGTGSNGKSIFLEHVLLRLLGTYGAKLSDSLIYSNDRGNQPFLEIAGLCGKRLGIGEENQAGAGLNENFLKSASGGDKQKGRYHYADFITYEPTAKLALVGNHQPRVEGRDHGFWRRFLLVDWPVKIPTERQDGELPEKLRAEMPGILNWCIAGAQEWLRQGLKPPESCRIATEKFKASSDSLSGFSEMFEESADGWITKAEVFDKYREWADGEGIQRNRQFTKRSLCFRLAERGWNEGRVGNGKSHAWMGVKEAE